jgi:hypothetical protein
LAPSLPSRAIPSNLGIQLKIENRRISEMEAIAIRSTARGSFSDAAGMQERPLLTQPLSTSQHCNRDRLVTVANSYFEGMEKGLPALRERSGYGKPRQLPNSDSAGDLWRSIRDWPHEG